MVYSPQLYENYTLQSGEGLSVLFVLIWLLADLANLVGALLGGLLPTVILLAVYVSFLSVRLSQNSLMNVQKYTICDSTLLCQIYYYRYKRYRLSPSNDGEDQERTALLGSEREPPHEEVLPGKILAIRYACGLAFVVVVGVAAWWITEEDNDDDADLHNPVEGSKKWWAIQVLGWSSALLFVCAQP